MRPSPRRHVAALLAALLPVLASGARAGELECLIEPQLTVSVSTPVEGIIEKVTVDRGDLVKRGQVLVELESSVERAAVEIAKARAEAEANLESNRVRLDFADRVLQRNQDLSDRNVISTQELDESRSSRELAAVGVREAEEAKLLAELDLRRARAALGLRTIRSPIDGVVVERHFSPGEFADTRAILDLAQIDPLRVEVFAPLATLGSIAVGMRAEVLPEEPVGGVHEATVTVVDRVFDAASGTYGVRLELPNPDHAIPAGLNCRLRLPEKDEPLAEGAAPDPAAPAGP